ncbi:MAG: hypothetical protein ACNA78_03100 [Balneolaceae bacterium]
MSNQHSTQLAETRSPLFAVIAVTLPFILLLLAELFLRQGNTYQQHQRLFTETGPNNELQAVNPLYAKRYFNGFQPSVAFHPFPKAKDEQTLRFFVLGGSSAAGFPYQFGYSFSESASLYLQRSFPHKQIEVINLGMSAVNSYTIRDLANHLHAVQPDGIMVYAGHNELYGAMGSAGKSRFLNRHRLKLFQLWLHNSAIHFYLTQNPATPTGIDTNQTLMEQQFASHQIAADDPLRAASAEAFEKNMRHTADLAATLQIPLFVGTVISNLGSQPPLGAHPDALLAYETAVEHKEDNRLEEAADQFRRARELDTVPFRAPAAINGVIRALSEDDHIHLIDVENHFELNGAYNPAFDTLFTDHLHLTQAAYHHVGKLYATAIAEVLNGNSGPELPDIPYQNDLLDDALATYQLQMLLSRPPFAPAGTRSFESRSEEALRQATSTLPETIRRQVYTNIQQGKPISRAYFDLLADPETTEAVGVTDRLRLHHGLMKWQPLNHTLIERGGNVALQATSQFALTEAYWLDAYTKTRDIRYLNILGSLYLLGDQLGPAEQYLLEVERNKPNDLAMLQNLSQLYIRKGDMEKATKYIERLQNLK